MHKSKEDGRPSATGKVNKGKVREEMKTRQEAEGSFKRMGKLRRHTEKTKCKDTVENRKEREEEKIGFDRDKR